MPEALKPDYCEQQFGLGALVWIAEDASRQTERVTLDQTEAVLRAAIRYGLVTVKADA